MLVWAIVDIVLNIGAISFYAATIGIMGPQLWVLLLIFADFLLIFGAWKLNTGLMMFWQIVNMIQIVLLFICWLAVPIMVYFYLVHFLILFLVLKLKFFLSSYLPWSL